jgi:hypothetical protein
MHVCASVYLNVSVRVCAHKVYVGLLPPDPYILSSKEGQFRDHLVSVQEKQVGIITPSRTLTTLKIQLDTPWGHVNKVPSLSLKLFKWRWMQWCMVFSSPDTREWRAREIVHPDPAVLSFRDDSLHQWLVQHFLIVLILWIYAVCMVTYFLLIFPLEDKFPGKETS